MENPSDPCLRSVHLPDWSERVFVLLDPTRRWAGAIQAELMSSLATANVSTGQIAIETCTTVREVSDLCDAPNVAGLVLFFAGCEREVLGLLRTIGRRCPGLPLLVICEQQHHDLVPVILESGVSCVLVDINHDLPIARWCQAALATGSGTSGGISRAAR